MNSLARLAVFAAAVTAGFGAAAAAGSAVGPLETGADTAADTGGGHSTRHGAGGYRLAPDATTVAAGVPVVFGFAVVDDTGMAVTAADELHDTSPHLIVVSRDLLDYLHLHPTIDAAGHWSVAMPALQPGSYRVFIDVRAGSVDRTLTADLDVTTGTAGH